MPIAVTEDHESLRQATQRWAQTHCPPSVPRAVAEAPPTEELPSVWEKMASQGWLGLHVPETEGGQGFTLAELAVVLEELGHALLPGPLLPTVLVSAALARRPSEGVRPLLAGLSDGSITAAVALGAEPLAAAPADPADPAAPDDTADVQAAGAIRLTGTVRPVLGQGNARLLLVPVERGDGEVGWMLIDRERSGGTLHVEPLAALDGTRTIGSLVIGGDGLVIPLGEQVWASDDEVTGLALDPGRGGERGDRTLVPPDGIRLREGPRAVWAADRAIPGGQARAGRHAGGGRAVCRGGLGRGGGVERRARGRTPARERAESFPRPQRTHRRRDRARCRRALREAVHPDPRRHRLHLGA